MSENYKSTNDAIKATLNDVLRDSPSGTQASAQVGSQIDHEHYHAGQNSGEKHVDAYVGTKTDEGVKIEKIHSDDK